MSFGSCNEFRCECDAISIVYRSASVIVGVRGRAVGYNFNCKWRCIANPDAGANFKEKTTVDITSR